MEQLNIYDLLYEKYKITKPLRLIELFSGYGSQALALKYLGVEFTHWHICEWATKSIQAYNDLHIRDYTDYSKDLTTDAVIERLAGYGISMNYNEPMTLDQIKRKGTKWIRNTYNNIIATHNLVDVSKATAANLNITDTEKFTYLLTYSFPCQDLSKAGLGKGMSKGSNTRSGMLWHVERILKECDQLPQILLMENVPDVIGQKNINDFHDWQLTLEKLGYKNYVKVLNSKDFQIPQHRERCFMVSLLGEYNYKMPKSIGLKIPLSYLLQKNVSKNFLIPIEKVKEILSPAETNEISLQQVIQLEGKFESIGRVYSIDGLAPTINTCGGGQREPKILIKEATKKGYTIAMEGDTINLERIKSKTRRGRVGKGVAQTILTSSQQAVIINSSNQRLINLIKNTEFKQNDTLFLDAYNQAVKNNIAGTITTRVSNSNSTFIYNDLIIRKLTPQECWRLMGVKDADYSKVAANQSQSSLNHLAGDSIVTTVLMAIFGELLEIDYKTKIAELVEELKECA